MKVLISLALSILSLCLFAFPQDQPVPRRGPSTPEERKRFVTLVHKLEKNPLDSSLDSEVKWALQWLDDIPDITVTICWAPLGHFVMEEYRYDSRIRAQFILGMGAVQIERPPRQADAVYLAGVESALKAYRSILKSQPEARSRTLDEIQSMQDNNRLPDYLHDVSKVCDEDKNMALARPPYHHPR